MEFPAIHLSRNRWCCVHIDMQTEVHAGRLGEVNGLTELADIYKKAVEAPEAWTKTAGSFKEIKW